MKGSAEDLYLSYNEPVTHSVTVLFVAVKGCVCCSEGVCLLSEGVCVFAVKVCVCCSEGGVCCSEGVCSEGVYLLQ